jgi:hypothetical protein
MFRCHLSFPPSDRNSNLDAIAMSPRSYTFYTFVLHIHMPDAPRTTRTCKYVHVHYPGPR